MNFNKELLYLSQLVDKYLTEYFDDLSCKISEKKLLDSMRYSVMAGGKRIRPVLTLSVSKMMASPMQDVLPFAAAIEMIHTYSLIHDDLPAMDDDEYRRGKLTNHKVYGEALAILAGDALLNEAFELLFKYTMDSEEKMKHCIDASLVIARAAGKKGMIAGQVIDMESEGKDISERTLKDMHRKKTGALIKASILAPAVFMGVSADEEKSLSDYADHIGAAFQIKDDILDVEGTAEEFGKPVGSDAKNNKTTYVSLYGLDGAKKMLQNVTHNAINALSAFGEKAWFLRETARFIAERTH